MEAAIEKPAMSTKVKKKIMLEALEKSLGVVTAAAKRVGINPCTHYKWFASDQKYKKAVEDISNIALDFVESKLYGQIEKGEVTSTIFYLKTKGKNRGYIERQEITGKDGQPLETPKLTDQQFEQLLKQARETRPGQ